MASPVKIKQLLVEKYRPSDLSTYVFQNNETLALVDKWVNSGEYPNVLLTGGAGCGKSTLARILSSLDGIDTADVKRVNGSSTNGIGFIREELEPWLRRSSYGKFKVVVIEEADRLTPNAQDALRDITEIFSDDVRFIMTANHPRRISEALQSRFEAGRIHLDEINEEGITELCLDIIEAEEISVIDADDFMSHITTYAPDIRKVINSIDKHTVDGVLSGISVAAVASGDYNDWALAWDGDEIVWQSLLDLTEGIDATNYDDYFEVMYNNSHHFPNRGAGLVHCAEYLYRCSFVANHRMLLDALIYHIFEIGAEE